MSLPTIPIRPTLSPSASFRIPIPPQDTRLNPDNEIWITRGQNLPGIVKKHSHSASATSLSSFLPKSRVQVNGIVNGNTNVGRENGHGYTGFHVGPEFRVGPEPMDDAAIRGVSRGVRLIGEDTNPRYQW